MDIGKRITYLRTEKKYSVNKLANLAGISQSYLRDIELGNKNPTVELLSWICEALELSLKDFFDEQYTKNMLNDPLLSKIYSLTPTQREALLAFLDTMME